MKNKRVKGLGIALSAALILGCTAPVAAAQMDGLQENSAVQTSTQTEEAASESSQSPTEKQEISVKETSEEKGAKKEEAGGQEQQTVSDTEKVPVSAAEVTEIPEETPDPTEVPEETTDPTVIPEKTLDSTAVPEETPESAAVPGEASGSTSAPEETPAPTATPAPEETPAPTPEEEQIQLPQVEQGWATGRESEDSDRVLWVLYKDGQIQQIWSWEQTGTWLQYDVEDTQLTEPAVPADGWYEIGSRKFLLKKGVPQTGWQANENGTGWYYCTDEAGSDGMGRGAAADPATMTGIRQINGSTYYLNADGTFRKNTTVDQDGTRYVLGTDGKVTKSYKPVTEQWMQNGNGWWYQHEDGTYPKNCWERIGGRLYSFDASGYMRSGGWYLENGTWYYLESSGAASEGWIQLNGTWYYLQPGTGKMQTGWYQVGSTWYYSDGSGAMYEGGWHLIGGSWYYMNGSGAMLTGWQYLNGSWYYLKSGGQMAVGWEMVDGIWYYMNGSGQMLTGWQLIGNTWYYMDGSGHMLTGWQNLGGTWYYLKDSGAMATGWQLVDGTWYYMNGSGAMYGGGWHLIGGSWYYMNGSGAMQTGWIRLGSTWYYLKDSGAMATGWQQVKGTWYYLDGSGAMLTGWQQIGGTWYYMNGSGAMLTGWQQIGGSWYYLTGSGAMATGWLQLGDDWYYLGSDGAMYANRWYGNYYLTADGTWDPDREGDQLDTLLQQVIDQVTTQAMSQEGKLRACYDYVVNTFSYERKYNFSNAAGWQRQYALEMLTKGRGNCYNFAATFGCLAEKLGYSNVRTIAGMTGKAGGGWTPHSWVEIDMNGTTYIFDPEMEHANGYDLWKKTYATSPLRYQKF